MAETRIRYVVNDTISSVWNRMSKSKLTWLLVGYIAVQAEAKFPQAAFATGAAFNAAFAAFLPHAIGGVAAILMRSAVTKAELAANAVNPGVDNVRAVEVPKQGGNYGKIGAMIVMAGFMGLGLTACEYGKGIAKAVTDSNGNPIVGDTVCFTGPLGARLCVPITKETVVKPPDPTPTPPAIAVAYTEPAHLLPGPVSYNEAPPPPFPVRPQLAK